MNPNRQTITEGNMVLGRWKEVLTQTAFRCTVHSDQYNLVKVLGVILGVRMDLDVPLVDYFQDTSVVWKLRWRCGMVVRVRGGWDARGVLSGWDGVVFDDDVEEGSDRRLEDRSESGG